MRPFSISARMLTFSLFSVASAIAHCYNFQLFNTFNCILDKCWLLNGFVCEAMRSLCTKNKGDNVIFIHSLPADRQLNTFVVKTILYIPFGCLFSCFRNFCFFQLQLDFLLFDFVVCFFLSRIYCELLLLAIECNSCTRMWLLFLLKNKLFLHMLPSWRISRFVSFLVCFLLSSRFDCKIWLFLVL